MSEKLTHFPVFVKLLHLLFIKVLSQPLLTNPVDLYSTFFCYFKINFEKLNFNYINDKLLKIHHEH